MFKQENNVFGRDVIERGKKNSKVVDNQYQLRKFTVSFGRQEISIA